MGGKNKKQKTKTEEKEKRKAAAKKTGDDEIYISGIHMGEIDTAVVCLGWRHLNLLQITS